MNKGGRISNVYRSISVLDENFTEYARRMSVKDITKINKLFKCTFVVLSMRCEM